MKITRPPRHRTWPPSLLLVTSIAAAIWPSVLFGQSRAAGGAENQTEQGNTYKRESHETDAERAPESRYWSGDASDIWWEKLHLGYGNCLMIDMDRVSVIFFGIPHANTSISRHGVPILSPNPNAKTETFCHDYHRYRPNHIPGAANVVVTSTSSAQTGTTRFSARWGRHRYRMTLQPRGESVTVGRRMFPISSEKIVIVVDVDGNASQVDDSATRNQVLTYTKNRIAWFQKVESEALALPDDK